MKKAISYAGIFLATCLVSTVCFLSVPRFGWTIGKSTSLISALIHVRQMRWIDGSITDSYADGDSQLSISYTIGKSAFTAHCKSNILTLDNDNQPILDDEAIYGLTATYDYKSVLQDYKNNKAAGVPFSPLVQRSNPEIPASYLPSLTTNDPSTLHILDFSDRLQHFWPMMAGIYALLALSFLFFLRKKTIVHGDTLTASHQRVYWIIGGILLLCAYSKAFGLYLPGYNSLMLFVGRFLH